MRTLLSHFCEQFEGIARPLLDPLGKAVEALAAAPFDLPARRILPGLRDVRQQFDALVDKVSGQQSYVLIFGPLKSGKSTLMNAVSGAYVSEVTCLPAYPCMVYVGNREQKELKVTRYDGQSTFYTDPSALRKALTKAHADLAEKVRARGDEEETFDPATHFPEAIRRVDVGLPASQLAKSGAVLVDTPGLYARMRFGYDRMTREFRNSAACAVFVVKTDNLFLEQVFDEFGRLLDLFSRIFLVVNVDSTKRDLLPDGRLEPSLEREDPKRVVEAFEKLSMDAPLRAALVDGKLKIYPVDLLRAASRRLRVANVAAGAKDALPAPTADELKEIRDFEAFQTDLTTYLNSNDYLRAFLGDSLRQADALIRETSLLCDMGPVRDLAARVAQLRVERDAEKRVVDRIAAAKGFDWKGSLASVKPKLGELTRDRAKDIRAKTADALGGVLDRWFKGDKGMKALLDDEVGGLLASCLREAGPMVQGALKEASAAGAAGGQVPFEIRTTLADLDISVDAVARAALDKVNPLAGAKVEKPEIATDTLPVQKTLLDWLLFRSAAGIRRQVFGTKEAPAPTIPVAVKGKRLGTAGREALRSALLTHLDTFFDRSVAGMIDRAHEAYAPAVVEGLKPEISAAAEEAGGTLAGIESKLRDVDRVVDEIARLTKAMQSGVGSIESLTKRHGETDPALLNRPFESATGPDEGDKKGKGKKTAAA